MDSPYAVEKLKTKLDWCKKYINEFNANESFDPYAALNGTESKNQILYGVCTEFITDIAQLINDRCEKFDRQRNEVVFGRCEQ